MASIPDMMKTLGIAAALAMLVGCGGGAPSVEPPAEGIIALSDQFSSDFSLIDQNGVPVANADLKGKVVIVYFGFATCPDVCPLALGRVSAALNELSEKERANIVAAFITVDPDRDTPEALKSYLAFDPRIIGLTGDRAAIEAAKASFKVFAQPQPLADSQLGYTVQHTSLFYLVDRQGRVRLALQDSLTPQDLAEMLRRAIKWR